MNRENNLMLLVITKDVQELTNNQVNAISKDYLLSAKYLEHRNVLGSRIIGGGIANNSLEEIVNNGLTVEERKEIFTSAYEIGSKVEIISDDLKEVFLLEYLVAEYGGESPEDKIKAIKREIKKLTNIDFKKYAEKDRSIAFKVLCLFYRVMICNYNRIFSLINVDATNDKSAFEFRDNYPIMSCDMSKRNSALISEVKASLLFDLDEAERFKIKNFFFV